MSAAVVVVFDRIGRTHTVAPMRAALTLPDPDLDALLTAIGKYARPFLRSSEIDVAAEIDPESGEGSGMILVGGFRNAGSFTVSRDGAQS